MSITRTVMNDTTTAIAPLLGDSWRQDGRAETDGSTILVSDFDPSRTLRIDVRPIFAGSIVALHLACDGIAFDATTGHWTEGSYTWNTAVYLADDDTDPAQQIADAILDRLTPAIIRKPRHVGDRPWEDEDAAGAEVHPRSEPAPTPKKTRARRRVAKKTPTKK